MTALTQDRSTPERQNKGFGFPVDAGKKISPAPSSPISHAGFAAPAMAATNIAVIGRARQYVDNTLGAAGAVSIEVKTGCYRYVNAGDITWANVGQNAYAVDDQTVSSSSAGNTLSVAGVIEFLDALGVWVQF